MEESRDPEYECCEVKNMCGRSLTQGVLFIGIFSMVVSLIAVIISLISLNLLACSKAPIVIQPVEAVKMVFALVSVALSTYQFIISSLLLWQSRQTKPNIFLCSTWYVSHLSILTLYSFLFFAKSIVGFVKKEYVAAIGTIVLAAVYEGTFIYFCIVVNSYIHSLDQVRYF